MSTSATKGYKSILSHSTTSGGSYTAFAQIKDIKGPKVEVKDIDISNQDSGTDGNGIPYKEYLPGWADAGEVTFDAIYKKAEAITNVALIAQQLYFKITYSDGAVVGPFFGYIKGYGHEAPLEDCVKCDLTIKISGPLGGIA